MTVRLRKGPSGKAAETFVLADAAEAQPTTLYVDQATTVSSSEQNGSVLAPYQTLTQAIAHTAAAAATIAWHLVVSFGDYQSEAPLQLVANVRYVFDGVFRSSVVMRLPAILWTVAGPGTSYLHFRNVEAGLVTVLDGSPVSTTTVIVYENSACRGINAAVALATITVLLSGTSLASFETSPSTFVLGVARAAAINLNVGTVFAQNIQFDATCPLVRCTSLLADGCLFSQDLQISGTSAELRECRWTGPALLLTFTAAAGMVLLDPHSQFSFDSLFVSVVNGSLLALNQTYDQSSVIPSPEGSSTGQSTFALAVTFVGASYNLANYCSATRLLLISTAVSAPTTIVIAVYQANNGQTGTPPIRLVGVATMVLTAPGTHSVPMLSLLRLGPGVAFFLIGKVSGGGNVTVRTYATPTQELLNDASVSSDSYPTAFTSTIGVSTSPPSTLNPTISGGLVTPSGASNLTPILRLLTP